MFAPRRRIRRSARTGELRSKGGDYTSKVLKENLAPTAADLGLSRKEIHEAEIISLAHFALLIIQTVGALRERVIHFMFTQSDAPRRRMTQMTKGKPPLTVQIPPAIRAALEPVAHAEHRSLRNKVIDVLLLWIEERNDGRAKQQSGVA